MVSAVITDWLIRRTNLWTLYVGGLIAVWCPNLGTARFMFTFGLTVSSLIVLFHIKDLERNQKS